MQKITLEEINKEIAEQSQARDQGIAQINFLNGYISALNNIKNVLEKPVEIDQEK